MSFKGGRILLAIALLSVAGAVVSSISLHHHYGASPSSFCDFGANFNCDMVNRSIYSTVFGIPVAFLVMYVVSLATKAPPKEMQDFIDSIRIPKGDVLHAEGAKA